MIKYIKPKSVTFWAGFVQIITGIVLGVHEASPIGWFGDALAVWVGPIGPHMLIANGFGLIGIRKALG